MFLMLVISSVRTVRTTSATSRIARVVSLNAEAQSTTTRSFFARSASSTRRIAAGVTSSAISGDGGARRTFAPVECVITKVSMKSASPPASSSGTRSAIDLFLGFRLSSTPTSPNWNEPSTRTTRLSGSAAAATAMLTAIVVRPTPPLGLKTATTRPGSWSAGGRPVDDRHRHASDLLALAGVDLADRRRELVRAERLDQELAGPGQHRAAQVVRLALDRHHHDRRGRDARRQELRGGDPVHLGHVDVHQDDVREELRGHLQRLGAGRGRPDHLDVLLEPEKLRQVVARLQDVVHDQDADLVAHRPVGLCLMAGLTGRFDRWLAPGRPCGPPRAARRLRSSGGPPRSAAAGSRPTCPPAGGG